MSAGVWVVVVAVVLAGGFGLWRMRVDGRFRGTKAVAGAEPAGTRTTDATETGPAASSGLLADTPWATELGERATLLQFSSAFCAPCRATRRILDGVATDEPGVAHIEVDAEAHLELVRRLGILRTPTTLILGPDGRELVRAAGAPTRTQVVSALPSPA